MAVAETTKTNGRLTREPTPPTPSRAGRVGRRRQLPFVVLGVVLVLGCALAFAETALRTGSREEVLVVTQPVAAGQILSSGDLNVAKVSTGSGVSVVDAEQESSVLGRRTVVPLVAGALLTSSEVGNAAGLDGNDDVVAVGLKAGAFPPELAAGDRVEIVPVTSSSSTGSGTASDSSGSPIGATVLSVEPASADAETPTVFSLQVAASDAGEVAELAAADQASLVEVGAGS